MKIQIFTDSGKKIGEMPVLYNKKSGKGLAQNWEHAIDNIEDFMVEAIEAESSLTEDDILELLEEID